MTPLERFALNCAPLVLAGACAKLIGLDDFEKGAAPEGEGGESTGGRGGESGSSGSATGGRSGQGGTAGKGGTNGTGGALGGQGGDGGAGGEEEGGTAGSPTGGSAGLGGTRTGGTGGAGAAGNAGGGSGGAGNAGGGMGGSAGASCTSVPVVLRGASFDSDTSAWASYGDPSARTIIVSGASQGITPISTPNIAYFGAVDDWYAGHFQRISIPAGATTLTLTGYRYITTEETSTDEAYDFIGIQLWDNAVTGMGRVADIVEYTNLDASSDWVSFSATVPVSARAGQTVDFDMWGENDGSGVTNFYIDSLVVTALVCL